MYFIICFMKRGEGRRVGFPRPFDPQIKYMQWTFHSSQMKNFTETLDSSLAYSHKSYSFISDTWVTQIFLGVQNDSERWDTMSNIYCIFEFQEINNYKCSPPYKNVYNLSKCHFLNAFKTLICLEHYFRKSSPICLSIEKTNLERGKMSKIL